MAAGEVRWICGLEGGTEEGEELCAKGVACVLEAEDQGRGGG